MNNDTMYNYEKWSYSAILLIVGLGLIFGSILITPHNTELLHQQCIHAFTNAETAHDSLEILELRGDCKEYIGHK